MSKSDVFHLGLTKNDLQGATLAIVPGDPDRVEKIAALMDKPVKLASHREFIPTNSVRGFPFLHTLSIIYYL